MVDVGQLWVRLGLESAQFKAGLADAKAGLVGWRDQTNQSTGEMAKWGTAIGATVAPLLAVGAACYSASQKYGQMADELKDLSFQTGVSTDKLQQMQYAAVISGTSFGSVAASLNKLTITMQEAADPSSKAYAAFMGLGVDPTGRTPAEVFDATAAKLVEMKDETQRNSYAMEIYGRSYKDLLPYMQTYIEKADEIKKAPIYSKKELKDLEDAKISWDKLTNSMTVYSGKTLAFITDLQNKANDADPMVKLLMGLSGQGGTVTSTRGADRDSNQILNAATTASEKLTDRYSGLSEEGLNYQLAVDEINAAQIEYNAALTGTQEELDKASIRLQQAKNDFAALREEMAKTAETAKATGPTYNSMFAPSLQTGGVGPDWGGYSELAGMTVEQLQEMAKGGLGKSKGQAELAQTYLDRMNTGGGAATEGAPGAKTKTEIATDNEIKLADQAIKTTVTLKTELTKRLEDYGAFVDKEAQWWLVMEEVGKVHYMALAEEARISDQAIMDSWAGAYNFIMANPAYEQIITMTNGVAEVEPLKFTPLVSPTLATADFSGVVFSIGTITGMKEDKGKEKSGSTVNQDITIINNGVKTDAEGVSKSLGKIAALGGALP